MIHIEYIACKRKYTSVNQAKCRKVRNAFNRLVKYKYNVFIKGLGKSISDKVLVLYKSEEM